jgi:hypothetical protein
LVLSFNNVLTRKCKTRLKLIAGDKHSSLSKQVFNSWTRLGSCLAWKC